MMNRATILILAGFLSGCAATLVACQAEDFVTIFSFHRSRPVIYHGRPDRPDREIQLNDPAVFDFVCMHKNDWSAVRRRLGADASVRMTDERLALFFNVLKPLDRDGLGREGVRLMDEVVPVRQKERVSGLDLDVLPLLSVWKPVPAGVILADHVLEIDRRGGFVSTDPGH